jgi:hypothetical protein
MLEGEGGPAEATGRGRQLSLEEALRDALRQLPPPDTGVRDGLTTYEYLRTEIEVGGIDGRSDLLVTLRRRDPGPVDGSPEEEPACWVGENERWEAWHDFMPGSSPTLHVVGVRTCPTPGFALTLEPVEPQGINMRDYRLQIVERKPEGAVPEVITPTEIQYREDTESRYDTVSIVPGGPTIEVTITR